jgi:hypothetical protein
VQQATKVELIINVKTAKALGLDVPRRCSSRRRGDRVNHSSLSSLLTGERLQNCAQIH